MKRRTASHFKEGELLSLFLLFLSLSEGRPVFYAGDFFFRLQRTYEFDSRIRSLIFEVIEDVEVYLRTQLSYYISQKYGPYGHLGDGMYTKSIMNGVFRAESDPVWKKNQDSPVIRQSLAKTTE